MFTAAAIQSRTDTIASALPGVSLAAVGLPVAAATLNHFAAAPEALPVSEAIQPERLDQAIRGSLAEVVPWIG